VTSPPQTSFSAAFRRISSSAEPPGTSGCFIASPIASRCDRNAAANRAPVSAIPDRSTRSAASIAAIPADVSSRPAASSLVTSPHIRALDRLLANRRHISRPVMETDPTMRRAEPSRRRARHIVLPAFRASPRVPTRVTARLSHAPSPLRRKMPDFRKKDDRAVIGALHAQSF
jgi:hypothetical protein